MWYMATSLWPAIISIANNIIKPMRFPDFLVRTHSTQKPVLHGVHDMVYISGKKWQIALMMKTPMPT